MIKPFSFQLLKSIGSELIVLSLVLFSVHFYLEKPSSLINGDGMGYYDYLPSLFIHQDFERKNISLSEDPESYQRITDYQFRYIYIEQEDRLVNKYPIGTALIEAPFFLTTLWLNEQSEQSLSGYEAAFQTAMFWAALFYLFLGLYFFKRMLQLFGLNWSTILFCQSLLALASPLLFYSTQEPAYSHVFSFFAISLFMFQAQSFAIKASSKKLIGLFFSLALVLLIRPANLWVLATLPFLVNSFQEFKRLLVKIFNRWKALLIGLLILLSFSSLQFWVFDLQAGRFFIDSYPGESFDFSNPYLFQILFGFKKGLFVYTPILLIAGLLAFDLLRKGLKWKFFTWMCFFFGFSYFLSSWWSWYFGSSFGHRAYIDFFPFLILPFAQSFDQIRGLKKTLLLIPCLLCIPLNLIQSYQYKHYVLHWENMTWERYAKVFLKTDRKFGGAFWKNELQDEYILEKEIALGDIVVTNPEVEQLFLLPEDSIPNLYKISFIKVSARDDFKEEGETHFTLSINEGEKNIFWHEINTVLLADSEYGEMQEGYFPFEFNLGSNAHPKTLKMTLHSNQGKDSLQDVRVQFLRRIW